MNLACFYLENGHVVMSVAFYASAEVKVASLKAAGVDANHVMLEEDYLEKGSLRQPLGRVCGSKSECRRRISLIALKPRTSFAIQMGRPSRKSSIRVPLRRVSEQVSEKQVQEMERKGWKKQAEIKAPVTKLESKRAIRPHYTVTVLLRCLSLSGFTLRQTPLSMHGRER